MDKELEAILSKGITIYTDDKLHYRGYEWRDSIVNELENYFSKIKGCDTSGLETIR